jgi:hypothetical protein
VENGTHLQLNGLLERLRCIFGIFWKGSARCAKIKKNNKSTPEPPHRTSHFSAVGLSAAGAVDVESSGAGAAEKKENGVAIPHIITDRELADPSEEMARTIAGWMDLICFLACSLAYASMIADTYLKYSVSPVDDKQSGDSYATLVHYEDQELPDVKF